MLTKKIVCLIVLALSGLLFTGCANERDIIRLEDVPLNEAMIVAKIRVLYNGEDVTSGSFIIFSPEPFTGPYKYFYKLDDSGYIFARHTAEPTSIVLVRHESGQMFHKFSSDLSTCNPVAGGVVNYIGDITIDWNGMSSGAALGVTILGGAIGNNLFAQGDATMRVESNLPAAQAAFQKKFSTDRTLAPALLVVKPVPPK